MTEDARFEDGAERPLRLRAEDAGDIEVVSALVQDAVLTAADMSWDRGKRRFSLLVNRFRWEDVPAALRRGREFERVRAILAVDDVSRVARQGLDPKDGGTVLSLLALGWEPGEDGTGRLVLTFSGDGAVALDVEAVNLVLQDVTRPYAAPSGKAPKHPE